MAKSKLGLDRFRALQASARGGILHIDLLGARVELAGDAVLVAEGRILV